MYCFSFYIIFILKDMHKGGNTQMGLALVLSEDVRLNQSNLIPLLSTKQRIEPSFVQFFRVWGGQTGFFRVFKVETPVQDGTFWC